MIILLLLGKKLFSLWFLHAFFLLLLRMLVFASSFFYFPLFRLFIFHLTFPGSETAIGYSHGKSFITRQMYQVHCIILFFSCCCFFFWDDILIFLDNRFIFFFFGINSYNHIYKGYGILHLITMVLSCAGIRGIDMPRS